MYSFIDSNLLQRLIPLLLALIVVFNQSLSCSVVQPCISKPAIPKLSYEMGTSNPRMLCPRSDPGIKFWEFAICDGDSRPMCTLLPGQFCLFPDTLVSIADVCTSDNGAKLVFKNITKLFNSSGTKHVNFTSDSFSDILEIQYSPTGVFVLEPIKQLSSDASIALLTWYTYTANQQINYTISHNGKIIADQSSNTVAGYGSVNLDNTVCVGSATGGEVTKEYTLLINNITATIGGEYVFKMDGIHEGVITLEVPEFNDTTSSSSAVPSVPSSSFITVSSSPVVPVTSPSLLPSISTAIVTMSTELTITQSSSPVTASSSIVTTTSSMTKAESTTPSATSPTASSSSDDNTVLLITILVIVSLLILMVVVVLVFVVIRYRFRKRSKVGESENGTKQKPASSFRNRKISAFEGSNGQSVDGGTLAVTPDPDPTVVRVLETSLQRNDNNLSSVSSNESTGSKRPLLLDRYRPEGSGSSLSGSEGGSRPVADLGSNNSASTLHPSSVQLDQLVTAVHKIDNNTQKILEKVNKFDEVGGEILEAHRENQEMLVNRGIISVEADVHESMDMTNEVERQSLHGDTPPITLRVTDTSLMVQEDVPDDIDGNDPMVDVRGSNDPITSHTLLEEDDDTQDDNDGDM